MEIHVRLQTAEQLSLLAAIVAHDNRIKADEVNFPYTAAVYKNLRSIYTSYIPLDTVEYEEVLTAVYKHLRLMLAN